jgi:hypothetical protein
MNRHRLSASGDRALREFYEACGLTSNTIEGAIKARYQEPTVLANRVTAGKLAAERASKQWKKRKVKV